MALNESGLQLNYLRGSATFLSSQSLSTAAHLMAVHNHILHEHFKPLKPRQHENFCGACGSPRKPEHTKKITIRQQGARRASQPPFKTTTRSGAIVYECLRCHKRTVQRLQSQNSNPSNPKTLSTISTMTSASRLTISSAVKSSSPSVSEQPAVTTVPKSTSVNASSKQRAKARKQGSLQVLLASKRSSQPQKSSTSSLDLLDFLQQ